jgi:hypothetical protein
MNEASRLTLRPRYANQAEIFSIVDGTGHTVGRMMVRGAVEFCVFPTEDGRGLAVWGPPGEMDHRFGEGEQDAR